MGPQMIHSSTAPIQLNVVKCTLSAQFSMPGLAPNEFRTMVMAPAPMTAKMKFHTPRAVVSASLR